MTGSAPSAPVPITSRWRCQGDVLGGWQRVCPYSPRNLREALLLRLRIFLAAGDQVVVKGHAVDSRRAE